MASVSVNQIIDLLQREIDPSGALATVMPSLEDVDGGADTKATITIIARDAEALEKLKAAGYGAGKRYCGIMLSRVAAYPQYDETEAFYGNIVADEREPHDV